jgi:ribose transport system substrate-binding protein
LNATVRRALLLALVLTSPGCTEHAPPQHLVAFSQSNNAEPYRAAQTALMTRLFSSVPNVQLVVSDAQQDNGRQIAQIGNFIGQKAGIPVICLERDIVQPNYTAYIGIDNRAIGRLAGQFIVDQLTRKYGVARGNVVMIRGLLGDGGQINRDGGAREILAQYPQIHIIADPVADWIEAQAKDRMTEVLRVQSKIDVVFGLNDPMAIGAYLAAKDARREKEIVFVGVDGLGGPEGGIKKVMDGVLAATFVYPLAVKEAVEVARQILSDPNYRPEKSIKLDSTMVTAANAAQLYAETSGPTP